ncbi:magnesium transporter [Christensenellaceae bacterium OttesenSCG-928-K19]|nr:magnesium transporter [Christensenellaceae bacterium OttesenSCG-928-K19]
MVKEIMTLYKTHNYPAVKEILLKMNIVDIADELGAMEESDVVKIFRMLPKDKAAEVFAYLDNQTKQEVVGAITDAEAASLIDDLFLDDAVDFIEEMPASVVTRILERVPREKREQINLILSYPDDSAGSIMTIEFVELKLGMTVKQAFDHIRLTGTDRETIYTCYVISPDRRLLGTVSVRALLLSGDNEPVENLMDTQPIYSHTLDDQESLMEDFRKYDLLALPVVDNENRLVGIVTIDDAFEIQEEEATEDFEIMAAMSPSEKPYLKTSVLTLTKNRILWLLLLMLSATATGAIISGFEGALAVVPALVTFIPMMMDTGGNAGSQSSTLVIRGMALEEIHLHDIGRVLWKEIRVAVLCGAVLVGVNFVRVLVTNRDATVALTVSLALFATVLVAKTVGCLLPMGAKKLKMDPAVMASPVITTIVDAASLAMFFGLAVWILKI